MCIGFWRAAGSNKLNPSVMRAIIGKLWKAPLLILLATNIAANDATPTLSSYRAELNAVRYGAIDIKAKGQLEFNLAEDGKWDLTISVKGGPLKSYERSVGERVNNQYRPLSYKKDLRVLFVREKIQWQFNWLKKQVTGKVQKDTKQHPLNDILHDQISFQVAMRQALMAGDQSYNTDFLRYSRPDKLGFEIVGKETIRIANQPVETLVIEQITPRRKDELKRIWVSPEHEFIALRFATYEDGKLAEDFYVTKLWVEQQPVNFAAR